MLQKITQTQRTSLNLFIWLAKSQKFKIWILIGLLRDGLNITSKMEMVILT